MAFVHRLSEVGAADRPWAGGKAAALGELTRAGLPVPGGCVVTTAAFGRTMAVMDPSGALVRSVAEVPAGDVSAIARAGARVRALVAGAPAPPEVASAITGAYQDLGAAAVAVRSSATMEDAAEASFAGLQDTYLAVRGASAVLDAVRGCWASLYNDESVGYRRRLGLPEDGLAMGVVIQRMVSPRAAGVMFTRSPVTGDRSVVAIEGTWGLGSALVGGEVTPDGFTVSKVTGEITGRRVGAKLRLHSFSPNGPGISVQDMPVALRGRTCLTDDEARALASVACRVEDQYGAAQDIEWALLGESPGGVAAGGEAASGEAAGGEAAGGEAASGEAASGEAAGGEAAERIAILQSRPETVWAARDAGPVATPKPRAADHVLSRLGKPL